MDRNMQNRLLEMFESPNAQDHEMAVAIIDGHYKEWLKKIKNEAPEYGIYHKYHHIINHYYIKKYGPKY